MLECKLCSLRCSCAFNVRYNSSTVETGDGGISCTLWGISSGAITRCFASTYHSSYSPNIATWKHESFSFSNIQIVRSLEVPGLLLLGIYLQKSDQSNQATLTITLLTAHEHTTITIFTLFYTILPHDRQLRGKPVRTFFTWIQRSQRTQKGQFRLLSGGAHRSRGSIFSNSSCPARRLHPAPNLRTSVGCTHSCRT